MLTDATTDMVITQESPVAPLYRFKTEPEAIKMAKDAPTLTLPRAGRERERSPPISTAAVQERSRSHQDS